MVIKLSIALQNKGSKTEMIIRGTVIDDTPESIYDIIISKTLFY